MKLKELMGSGDKIMLYTLPFLVISIVLNFLFPNLFKVVISSTLLNYFILITLTVGLIIWIWSVVLILINVPKTKLITSGPFKLMRHPLYTAVSLLVIPCTSILLNSWIGLPIGVSMYLWSRQFSKEEEKVLQDKFGKAYTNYRNSVTFTWL